MRIGVHGMGFWAPGYPSIEAWSRDAREETGEMPPCKLAHPRLLRGTSLLTRMSVEAATQACERAGWDLSKVSTIFGSAFGETNIALAQFEMMRTGDGTVSPHRFKNSVHNTGAGVFAIAAKNHGFTTALAGGWETVANVLLEASALLADGHEHVIACAADEPLPGSLEHGEPAYLGMGVAFALAREEAGGTPLALLDELKILHEGKPPVLELGDSVIRNPVAPGAALAKAIFDQKRGEMALTVHGETHWTVKLR